ncbi:MAG TPA: primosomal protein N', partial [Lysobacter sp.]|nr:primosomal protein N' [Lysobacter sp.]
IHEPFGEVVATALPTLLRHGEPLPPTDRLGWRLSATGVETLPRLRPGRPRRLAERLASGDVAEDELDSLFDDWRAALRSLDGRGLVEQVVMTPATTPAQPGPAPNDEQRAAIDAILASRDAFSAFLLDGITGSGKTEVYLHAIADCLARGRQALVLVPEIGLTPQTLARFRARLGVPVYALHSGLSDGERARTWAACLRGQARVVVGTRSAVFLPLPDAGLIVVDEEHDGSYKQLDGIRYHARDFAIYRASQLRVPIVLGSATPSMESLRNARTGRYAHLHLRRRAGVAKPPAVRVIDVRKRALDAGLSNELIDSVSRTLQAGGQVLVFKNRRGYAPVLLCHDCGWTAECLRCDASMTVHAKGRRLQCHHCGAGKRAPDACPDCGGLALQPQGAGTEKLEETLAARFPQVPVVRIDKGTTRNRDALAGHIETLGDGPGILVGTQMLAKGHDLPGLTLVAVVGIDEGLFSADFRAPEKLAQLLVQVAGRAGRAEAPGDVLLQTHHPEHPLLHTLLTGGYAQFADEELALREHAQFPPFAHMAMFRAEARDMDIANAFLVQARAHLEATAPGAVLTTHGPLPAPMPRRAGYQRAQLVVSSNARPALHAALDDALPSIRELPEARRVRWSLDVDPVDLY